MSKIISIGDAIHQFLEKYNLREEMLVQQVISGWKEYVGEAIANNTQSVEFDRGNLIVKMRSPVWRHELAAQRNTLRDTLNAAIGKDLIREIKVL